MTEKQIQVAVDWWASQLGGTTGILGDHFTPSELQTQAMVDVMMKMSRDRSPVTEESRARFRAALTRILSEHEPNFLRVDYHPDRYLANAAGEAGIHSSHFPLKSAMILDADGSVRAYAGYGQPYETLLAGEGGEA